MGVGGLEFDAWGLEVGDFGLEVSWGSRVGVCWLADTCVGKTGKKETIICVNDRAVAKEGDCVPVLSSDENVVRKDYSQVPVRRAVQLPERLPLQPW